jgi:hypothetical protein
MPVLRCVIAFGLAAAVAVLAGTADPARAQEKKAEKRSGSVTGELKSRKDTPNGKNVTVEVLAAGEEKARSYRVMYDPAVKGPLPDVLKAVKAANVGDKVELDWVDTGEGLGIKKFAVLKKGTGDKK